jgi:ankyrin repeat protein
MPVKAPTTAGYFAALCAVAMAPLVAAADSQLADAVEQGSPELVRSLIADTVSINAPQVDGTTALHWAVRANDPATTALLIAAGADVEAVNRYGISPMYLAALNGNADLIAMLLAAGADANSATPGGETAAMTAARTGNPEALEVLLDHGADVDARESAQGQTALMWAVLENHVPVVELLLEHGADVNAATTARPPRGWQPPDIGFRASAAVFIPFAIATPDGGMTPLLFAIRNGDAEMTRFLLEQGADLELASANRTTPLLLALLNGQVEIATMLLERGANPNALDDYDRGPLFAAVDLRNFNFVRYPEQPSDGREPLDLIKKLLARGADPNQQSRNVPIHGHLILNESWVDFDGQTPFIRAALSGDIELMRLLLEHGADPAIATRKGTTALMAAAGVNWKPTQTFTRSEDEFVEAVELCLELGIDVNAVNSQGLTAMHGAAHRGWTPIIELLAESGADLNVREAEGRLPLDYAKGIFLTVSTSPPQPEASALLERLMGEAAQP